MFHPQQRALFLLIAMSVCLHVMARYSAATVVVSNLGNTTSTSGPVSEQYGANPTPPPQIEGRMAQWWYNPFSTGALSMSLDFVTLSMADGFAGSTGFTVDLLSDAGGSPGASLITLVGNSAPVSAGLYDYAPAGPFTLQAATTYWIYARIMPEASPTMPDKREFNINITSDISESGLPGWSIGDQSRLDGAYFDNPGPRNFDPLQFAVNASVVAVDPIAIPEPSTFALLGIGAIGLGIRARRQRVTA